MGEEIHTSNSENDGRHGEDERVLEWETGLPNSEDLVPLSQSLVPQKLASAFSINPEPYRSTIEVSRACEKTISIIRSQFQHLDDKSFHSFIDDHVLGNSTEDANDAQKGQKLDNGEEVDSISPLQSSNDDPHSRALKKPRLVWTPQLHKRFVDAVTHLGIKNVVPKTIMQLMNVEGLTRENVASHLQKYRLYIKRMQGLSSEGPSSTDNFFSSTHNSQEPGGLVHLPMPYMAPLVPMPVLGVPHGHGGMTNGFNHNHPYRLRE